MDYSVAVIPVTKADKSLDLFDHDYQPLNETDRKNWEACKSLFKFRPRAYTVFCLAYEGYQDDPDIYDGARVGLQIVARKHEEEKVWAMTKIVDAALKTMGARDHEL